MRRRSSSLLIVGLLARLGGGGQAVIGAEGSLHDNFMRVGPGATVRLGLARGVVISVKAGKLP